MSHDRNRRALIRALVAGGAFAAFGASMAQTSATPSSKKARVVVIGGGYGGATAARYLRYFSAGSIDVVLVEQNERFISCPLSNLVLADERKLADITQPYTTLASRHGVEVVHDRATAVDPRQKTVKLARGAELRYDKLVLSPGVEFMLDRIEGLGQAHCGRPHPARLEGRRRNSRARAAVAGHARRRRVRHRDPRGALSLPAGAV